MDMNASMIVRSLFTVLAVIPGAHQARAETELGCSFSTVCLETSTCSVRDLQVMVSYNGHKGQLETPGQSFKISRVQDAGSGAVSFLTEESNGSTAFLTVYNNLEARLTLHFHRPEPTAMTNFGQCEGEIEWAE